MCNIGNKDPFVKIVALKEKEAKIGYRFLDVSKNGTLHPIAQRRVSTLWNKKIAKSDKVPTSKNKSGLYIFTTRKEALKQGFVDEERVLVRVKYWGAVVTHYLGIRANFASICNVFYGTNSLITESKYDNNTNSWVCVQTALDKQIRKGAPLLKNVPISKFRAPKKIKV